MWLIVSLLGISVWVILACLAKACRVRMLIRGMMLCMTKHFIQFSFIQPNSSARGAIIYFYLTPFHH